MTAFELAGKLKLDSSEFTSSLGKQESAFKKFGNKISNTAKMVSKIAKASVVAGTVMFTKASIQEGLNFDKAMSQVAATLGKTTDEIQDLAKFARDMGAKTAFSATEAAEALNYMALAGYDADTSMKMLPTVLNLAAAGNIDLAKASDMVTDAQSALGLSIEGTERMVDQMAKTSSKTNTSVEQLGDAFLTVGGTAKMMGKGSIDTTTELSMALGVLADNGIKGAEGGTMLRNILLSLSAPTDKAAKKLKELGVDVFDSSGEMRDLPFILQDINEATKDMTDQERTDFLSEVFNKRDLKAIEALLGTDMSRWKELFDEIGNAEGSAEKMAETQLDNLAGDLTIFNSALSEAKISISDKLAPTLRKFVQKGTQWVQRLTTAFNEKGLGGALKEAKVLLKETLTESLGLGSDASWGDIGRSIADKIKTGIKNAAGKAKVKIANLLGLTDDSGQAIDDPSDVSWLNIAKTTVTKLKDKFKEATGAAKVKLANLLGMTDENGQAVDDPGDTTWGAVAKKAFDTIREKFTGVSGAAKVKLANLLGLTDDSGNAVDDPSDTTWGAVAKKAFDRLKEKFTGVAGDAKVRLANLLGLTDENGQAIDDPSDTTWKAVGGKMLEKIKEGMKDVGGKTKVKLANLLGLTDDSGNAVDDPGDTSWSKIAEKMKEKLKGGFDTLKVKLSDLLGLTPEGVGDEVDWADIGKNILDKLTNYFSHKGDFLKKLILGDEFTDKSTWLDVGKKMSGWLEEAFAEGGLLNAILGDASEKAVAIASFAGELLSGFATWLKSNTGEVVTIIQSILTAISEASGPIIEALGKILSSPELWTGLGEALEAILLATLRALGLIPEEFTAPDSNAPAKKGERQLRGNALDQEQLDSIMKARKIAMENPNGMFMDANGNTVSAQGFWGGIFKSILGQNNFSQEAIDALWNESVGASDAEFAKTLTDLANASMANADQFAASGEEIEASAGGTASDLGTLGSAASSAASELGNIHAPNLGGDDDGSNAKGLWDVPYDDYKTRLHRDEMVLSASRARDYREGNVGVDSSGIINMLQGLRNDLSNLQLVVGRKTFGRAVVDYGGDSVNGYIGGAESRYSAGFGT